MEKVKAIIYKPAKHVMQSGDAKDKRWIVKFVEGNHRFVNPLTGWIGSDDTSASQITLKFVSEKDAIDYVESKGYEYEAVEPKEAKFVGKAYADNFK